MCYGPAPSAARLRTTTTGFESYTSEAPPLELTALGQDIPRLTRPPLAHLIKRREFSNEGPHGNLRVPIGPRAPASPDEGRTSRASRSGPCPMLVAAP